MYLHLSDTIFKTIKMKLLKILPFVLLLSPISLLAQSFVYSPEAVIPVDAKTIKKTLDNGFTYYIRQNKAQENKVELRLVINAGSILETEKQQGLGHFLEHMSFNGTESFPNAELIKTLEGMGVRFGKDLNAYTSFDETIYYLPIPSNKVSVGLTVLKDWAMNLTLSEKEIERERGVVLEELRLGKKASTRIREKYLPVLLAGSLYPLRLPIGKEEVLQHFTSDELRNYYKKWHRPDLMAIMVIGDINPTEIEKEIIQKFGVYKMPENSEPRPVNPVPDHKETKVVVATDPEMSGCSVEISYKHKPQKTITQQDYVEHKIYHALYSSMINDRLKELQETETPPFSEAESGYSNYFREVDTYSSYARCTPSKILNAFHVLIVENERVKRYGFTNNELERAKKKLLSRYERWYNERGKTASDLFADEYQVNYLSGEPIPGIEYEYELVKKALPGIRTADLNSLVAFYMTDNNRVVVVTGPESPSVSYPDQKEFLTLLAQVGTEKIKPYREDKVVKELMSSKPKAGTIISERSIPETGLIEWKLSNGATVVFKKTDFKNNQVLFRATSNGGFSNYTAKDDMSALYATKIQDESGVNGINNTQLKRLMAGKDLSLTQSLVLYNESMSGKYGLKDSEAFFQLLYLYQTAPYFNKNAFKRLMNEEKTEYAKLLDDPSSYFNYQVEQLMNNGNPRRSRWPVKENLDQVDFNRAVAIYKARFGSAAGFTYVFVGNVDIDSIKPLVLTYIGGLPSNKKKQGYAEQNFTSLLGPATYTFKKGTEDKADVAIRFVKCAIWDKQKAYAYSAFVELLKTRLYESLRREMSGVYGVKVSGKVNQNHEPEASLSLSFGTNTASYEALYKRAILEVKRLMAAGPTNEELERVKEKMRVTLTTDIKENATWLLDIYYAYRYGDTVMTIEERKQTIEQLNSEKIKEAANEYIDPDKALKFILLPEENTTVFSTLPQERKN